MIRLHLVVARIAVRAGVDLNWIFDPFHCLRLWWQRPEGME